MIDNKNNKHAINEAIVPGANLIFPTFTKVQNNKLNFSTKKNFKTSSTELYDISYQYEIDCLAAGLSYRREFYQDADLEPKNSLMFTITFVPFSSLYAPVQNP